MKVIMTTQNGQKDKTRQIRRAETESEYGVDSQQHRHPGRASGTDGYKPIRGDRAICQGTYRRYSTGASDCAGGIVRRLISKSLDRLAKLKEQVKEETNEIQLLESVLKRLEIIEAESKD